jgi:dTDP-4-amino-4,6-dideoxygalactose transaminase
MSKLAIFGGDKAIKTDPGDMFTWPIPNQDMVNAAAEVIRGGTMSGIGITKKFEEEYAAWNGVKYALAHTNGTASLEAAMFAVGLGKGDELICPTITYWASCTAAMDLGAKVVFADINPDTIGLSPESFEEKITDKTKAVMVVHYFSVPADMDKILEIASKHGIKVIEDISHAHGAMYKGRMVGSLGDVAGASMMSGKAFAIGEGGMLLTDNREIYERALLWGHYARHKEILNPDYINALGIPWGGHKNRMNQVMAAIGRVQLKKYPTEIAEIESAMTYFCDALEKLPGLRGNRPPKDSGITMGGWYAAHGMYNTEELGGLSLSRFNEALLAEVGVEITGALNPGCNICLHKEPVFNSIDIYHEGTPTNEFAPLQKEVILPEAEAIQDKTFFIPWFKHLRKEIINEYIEAYTKVTENYEELLPGDQKKPVIGANAMTKRKG